MYSLGGTTTVTAFVYMTRVCPSMQVKGIFLAFYYFFQAKISKFYPA